MKRIIVAVIVFLVFCVVMSWIFPSEESEVAEVSEVSEVRETTEPELSDAERVGVSEIELREILKCMNEYGDYKAEEIDLIRKGNDTLVEYEEYIIFMKNGDVNYLNLHKSLLEE